MKDACIVILVTANDKAQARRIANGLLKEKLIACANMISGVESLFLWQGKIDHAKETLLILKTKKSAFQRVAVKVKSLHSYQTPEIIAFPITAGEKTYLKWIRESVC